MLIAHLLTMAFYWLSIITLLVIIGWSLWTLWNVRPKK
jgi:hypothetical protein